MTNPAFIICFALIFVFSMYIGFTLGTWVGERTETARSYWLWNLAGVAVAVAVTPFLAALPLLFATPLGLLAGFIAGLKMGFGESVGPWAVLDRFFNVNRAHRQTTERGTGAARRRRRRRGEAAPDVISVASDARDRSGGKTKASGRDRTR